MATASAIVKGRYLDSVKLMRISRELREREGVHDAVAIVGTEENKSILRATGMLLDEFSPASASDICLAIRAETQELADSLLAEAESWIKGGFPREDASESRAIHPRTLEKALERLPGADLALISVAGQYAAAEAWKALKRGLNVLLFSDNVSLEDERKLKEYAVSRDLLMMGPDCGTSLLNGTALAFANRVRRGRIGIVSAAGTGLQEVSSLIHNQGCGVSQGFGTGGRDGNKEIGGLMILHCLKYLLQDPDTGVIILISKPPDKEVTDSIMALLRNPAKPVIFCFLGSGELTAADSIFQASTLAEAGILGCRLARGEKVNGFKGSSSKAGPVVEAGLPRRLRDSRRKYLRGLYSGGTLCYEAQDIFFRRLGIFPWSNTPLDRPVKLSDVWKSRENTMIDMGSDEFTKGRLHPMIDLSLRIRKLEEESRDPETAVILFDIVLGYGAHPQPQEELAPIISRIKETGDITLISAVIGTDDDPQDRQMVMTRLRESGVKVFETNAEAAAYGAEIIAGIKGGAE